MEKIKRRLLVIGGPTSSGKTKLALVLAKNFGGEIVSADSRQIYQGMDIGTGKDLPAQARFCLWQKTTLDEQIGYYQVGKVPIWLLDIVRPDVSFSVNRWVKLASKVISYLWKKNKLPLIVGGTGFWLKALLEGVPWGNIPPNPALRARLNQYSLESLQKKLRQQPRVYWETLTIPDWQNRRRLIRRLEVAAFLSRHPQKVTQLGGLAKKSKVLFLGLRAPSIWLRKRIRARIQQRIRQGLLSEIQKLLRKGFDFNSPGLNTLGYKEFRPFFSGEKSEKDLPLLIKRWFWDEWHYARRQIAWFKKQKGIIWLPADKENLVDKAMNLVENWLKEK